MTELYEILKAEKGMPVTNLYAVLIALALIGGTVIEEKPSNSGKRMNANKKPPEVISASGSGHCSDNARLLPSSMAMNSPFS